MAQPERHGIPGHGLAADAARAFGLEPGHARPHGRDVAQGKFVGHAVGVEGGMGVDFRSAFEHDDIDTEMRQVGGKRAAGRA